MKRLVLALSLTAVMTLAGCGIGGNDKPLTSVQIQQITSHRPHIKTADTARLTALQDRRVDDAAAVAMDKELSVALKVSNFNRLKLRQIRRDIHNDLRQRFPEQEVHVTTDSKLFHELQKLEKSFPERDEKQVKQELKKINEDMKG